MPDEINFCISEYCMPEKFWLHRVDSVKKQEEFYNKYDGLEFDIIYYENNNGFENSHDPENYENYNLEKQLSTYQYLGKKNGIWFDFKNLNNDNKVYALNELNRLLAKYNIDKDIVWIESHDWQALKIFKDNKYRTSYYFPYYDLKTMNKNDMENIKMMTRNIALSGNIDAISFDGDYYDFIKTIDIPSNIVFLSWLDGSSWSEVWLRKKYSSILDDKRVKVILVKDKGKNHR